MMRERSRIALYGLGTETEQAIVSLKDQYDIVGLLDGFKTEGELFGKQIISIDDAMKADVEKIIVVARPGSCKAIARRIGDKCKEAGVKLYDIRGLDLLHPRESIYDTQKIIEIIDKSPSNRQWTTADNLKIRMFKEKLSKITSKNQPCIINHAYDIGYLFCAPLITDFVLWLYKQIADRVIENIWFSARDGFLIKKLFEMLDCELKSTYFLTSRCAAMRAGVEDKNDISYADSMKFSGTLTENLKVRFGIDINDIDDKAGLTEIMEPILEKAHKSRKGYEKYISRIEIKPGNIALFDFVAKGTVQYFVGKIVLNHIKGFYFLQLEPDFMKNKGLDIVPFYSNSELEGSAIFDNYYILETILTSPEPSLMDFDLNGNPIYAKETRTQKDIECFVKVQNGITDYFQEYIRKCPKEEQTINKPLDEIFLKLIHNIEIRDDDFLGLTIEDMFFNRITDIIDLL